MTPDHTHTRWRRMKVRAFIIAAAVVASGLLMGGLVWQKLETMRVQTVSVSLTSEGNVIWGDAHVGVNAMESKLQRSAHQLRSHGFQPRLLIERYRDTRDTDVADLARIGHDAGFVILETAAHDWGIAAKSGRPKLMLNRLSRNVWC